MYICKKIVSATLAMLLILLLPSISYAKSPSELWGDFLSGPSEHSYRALDHSLNKCAGACVKGMLSISVDMMEKLEDLISDGDGYSVSIGLKTKEITNNDNEVIEFIDRGLARAITRNALETLKIVRKSGVDEITFKDFVTLTSRDSIDDVPRWRFELVERQQALKRVSDSSVATLRDTALQEIEILLKQYADLPDDSDSLCMGKPCHE